MHYDSSNRPRSSGDPALRELLFFLRDTCREIASRIDRYLVDSDAPPRAERWERSDRSERRERRDDYGPSYDSDGEFVHNELERLREEARALSGTAAKMDPSELRLRIEAVTAETRALQLRAEDPEDREQAARILRVLTAIVSEHRPGHVYGLARHHQTDWEEMARRARETLARGPLPPTDDPLHE